MKVFWSWQNDTAPKVNRHFIRDALFEAVECAGDELGLEDAERPELDHDTKNTPGMAEISATILKKISRSAVFVADVTPIGRTESGKALPNPNVLIELGWALNKPGPDRIIAVLNTADGWTPADLPFDIRHRLAMTYNLAETADKKTRDAAKKMLVRDLTEALRQNLGQHAEDQATSTDITGVPANPDDPSIWASATRKIEFYDTIRGRTVSCPMPSCARGYIRIIPAGWKNGIPSVTDIANIPIEQAVQPQLGRIRDGDFGICEEGFVRYWLTDILSDEDFKEEFETRNVAMWFEDTGEFWVIHGTAIDGRGRSKTLMVPSLIYGWYDSLHRANAFFDAMGALPVRKVEAGLAGMEGVTWPGRLASHSPRARRGQCLHIRQRRDWNDEAQIEFLTEAHNKVRNLFGLDRTNQDETRKLIHR